MEINSATAALLGALIGGCAGVGSGIASEAFKRYRDRVGTASALAGEVASILDMTELRNHVGGFEQMLEQLKAGVDVEVPPIVLNGHELPPVIAKHIERLGLLGPTLPERVVKFYTQLMGVRLDLTRLASDEFKDQPEKKAHVIEEDLRLWQATTVLGRELVPQLQTIGNRAHWIKGNGALFAAIGVLIVAIVVLLLR